MSIHDEPLDVRVAYARRRARWDEKRGLFAVRSAIPAHARTQDPERCPGCGRAFDCCCGQVEDLTPEEEMEIDGCVERAGGVVVAKWPSKDGTPLTKNALDVLLRHTRRRGEGA